MMSFLLSYHTDRALQIINSMLYSYGDSCALQQSAKPPLRRTLINNCGTSRLIPGRAWDAFSFPLYRSRKDLKKINP